MLYGEIHEIPFRVLEPPKLAILRIPTAAEMLERLRNQKTVRRSLGRRRNQFDFVPNPAADLLLLEQITISRDGEPFDSAEAEHAIGVLSGADVTGSRYEGSLIHVEMEWKFFGPLTGNTTHSLRLPTVKQVRTYRQNLLSVTDLAHNNSEIRFRIEAATVLYDAILDRAEGYAAGVPVPPHHKSAVIAETIAILEELQEDANSESFRQAGPPAPPSAT